jgi:hypothetical protein
MPTGWLTSLRWSQAAWHITRSSPARESPNTGGHGDATHAQLERQKVRPDKKLAQCGFVGFHRKSVESKLPWLMSLIGQRTRKAA